LCSAMWNRGLKLMLRTLSRQQVPCFAPQGPRLRWRMEWRLLVLPSLHKYETISSPEVRSTSVTIVFSSSGYRCPTVARRPFSGGLACIIMNGH